MNNNIIFKPNNTALQKKKHGEWTTASETAYMISMMRHDPPNGQYGTKKQKWDAVLEDVNNVNRKEGKHPLSEQSIQLHYKDMFADFERRNKEISLNSGGNGPYSKLDKAIKDYKDMKTRTARRKSQEKNEAVEMRDEAAEKRILDLQKRLGQVPSCSVNRGQKRKAIVAEKDGSSAIDKYLGGSAEYFQERSEIDAIREEVYQLLNGIDQQESEQSRQVASDIKSCKESLAAIDTRMQAVEDNMKEINQMLGTIIPFFK